ncbi:MAG: photosynthetic reaction center subunit H [Pseudomonadota bacterium]
MVDVVGNIDVAVLTLYVFWLFFAGLIFYIRQEDRREGYPLEDDMSGKFDKDPWLWLPKAKTYDLPHGLGTKSLPNAERDTRPLNAERMGRYDGSPLVPTGDPMGDNIGPGSWAERADRPDLNMEGHIRIVPMRTAGQFSVAKGDPDPRGLTIFGCDKEKAGVVSDVWVDTAESLIRYLEVTIGEGELARTVVVPNGFATMRKTMQGNRYYYVHAITADQFKGVPALANPNQITLLEEDKIMGYFGGGQLYATPRRQESYA